MVGRGRGGGVAVRVRVWMGFWAWGRGGYVITAKDGIGGCGVGSGDPGHDTGYLSFFRRVIGNTMLREPVRRRLRLCPHDGTVDT